MKRKTIRPKYQVVIKTDTVPVISIPLNFSKANKIAFKYSQQGHPVTIKKIS